MRTACLLLIGIVGATGVSAQQPDFTLRVNVPLVLVEAQVVDSVGRPVTNLIQDDFVLTDEGEPREILNFSPVDTPFNILLLFDRSGSTSAQQPFMRDALARLLGTLRPQDRIAIAAFDGGAQMLAGWRNAKAAKDLQIRIGTTTLGTNFYGAVDWAVRQLENVSGRKGVIVFSDGRDSRLAPENVYRTGTFVLDPEYKVPRAAGDSEFQKTLRGVRQSGTPFYFVAINTDQNLERGQAAGNDYLTMEKIFGSAVSRQYLIEARSRMETISELSGGRIFFPRALDEVGQLYEQISKELGTSYSLGFTPVEGLTNSSFRRITVRLRHGRYRVVQSREGYYTF